MLGGEGDRDDRDTDGRGFLTVYLTTQGLRRFRPVLGGGRGPELAAAANSGSWVTFGSGTLPTQDASGILFTAVTNATGVHYIVTLEDNVDYEAIITISGLTLGSVKVQVYGPTTNHLGASAALNANGTYVLPLNTSATGSLTNRIRIIANGTGTNNSYRIASVSLKKVLP